MNKTKVLIISGVLVLTLAGCSAAALGSSDAEKDTHTPEPLQVTAQEGGTVLTAESTLTPAPEPALETQPIAPSEEEVLAAREQALAGMTQEQIDRLNTVIREANMWWEHGYLYLDVFGALEDPNSLFWNQLEKKGSIQIGWEISGNMDMGAICEQENLSEDEFYSKYGTPFIVQSEYDTNDFVIIMDELIATVKNKALRADLQYIRDEAQAAVDEHVMEHANNEYKALHDMDYFLLRYSPTDVGPYVKDDSTITKYYGTLSIYG